MQLETDRTSSPVFKTGIAALRRLGDYHQYRAYGLDKLLSTEGGLLVACNHSFATYDAILLALAGYDASGRWFHAMADRLFFRIPVVSSFFTTMGFVEGTRSTATDLLRRGEVLGVLPGGMREALRPTHRRYTIDWRDRLGFVWLSMTTGTPIALAACPRADDIFSLLPNPITPVIYDRLRVPLALFHGRGPTPLPRPIKLWHLVSEPIYPSVAPDQVTERDVVAHHAHLTARMTSLMHAALDLAPPAAS